MLLQVDNIIFALAIAYT